MITWVLAAFLSSPSVAADAPLVDAAVACATPADLTKTWGVVLDRPHELADAPVYLVRDNAGKVHLAVHPTEAGWRQLLAEYGLAERKDTVVPTRLWAWEPPWRSKDGLVTDGIPVDSKLRRQITPDSGCESWTAGPDIMGLSIPRQASWRNSRDPRVEDDAVTVGDLAVLEHLCTTGDHAACKLAVPRIVARETAAGLDRRAALSAACERRNTAACVDLAAIAAQDEPDREVERWRHACDLGLGSACRHAAQLVPADGPVRPESLLEQGCLAGDAIACQELFDLEPDIEVPRLQPAHEAWCRASRDILSCSNAAEGALVADDLPRAVSLFTDLGNYYESVAFLGESALRSQLGRSVLALRVCTAPECYDRVRHLGQEGLAPQWDLSRYRASLAGDRYEAELVAVVDAVAGSGPIDGPRLDAALDALATAREDDPVLLLPHISDDWSIQPVFPAPSVDLAGQACLVPVTVDGTGSVKKMGKILECAPGLHDAVRAVVRHARLERHERLQPLPPESSTWIRLVSVAVD